MNTNTAETKLLPCPFCKGKAEQDLMQPYRNLQSVRLGHSVAIYCTSCNASMSLCREDYPESNGDELFEIIKMEWNTRTTPPSTPQPWHKAAAEEIRDMMLRVLPLQLALSTITIEQILSRHNTEANRELVENKETLDIILRNIKAGAVTAIWIEDFINKRHTAIKAAMKK